MVGTVYMGPVEMSDTTFKGGQEGMILDSRCGGKE
jgi:hypothetical protein